MFDNRGATIACSMMHLGSVLELKPGQKKVHTSCTIPYNTSSLDHVMLLSYVVYNIVL